MPPVETISHATCHLCEASCGLDVAHDGERIAAIRGDALDPASRGHLCVKALALKELQADPERLRAPMRRVGSQWESCSWEAALDEAAAGIAAVADRHGRDAVGVYVGNPAAHSYGTVLLGRVLLQALGTRSFYTANSVDGLPRILTSWMLYGNQLHIPVPDVDRTSFLLVLGANPVVSNGSVLVAPGITERLKGIRARGGEVVVVDPRRTETAELATQHVAIRPGGDAAFLASLLHVILAEGLAAPGALAARVSGLEALPDVVAPFAPEQVAAATGVAPEVARDLARRFATRRPASCYGRIGTCTQENGTVATWLVDVMNVVTGNLDVPGGAVFARDPANLPRLARLTGMAGGFDRFRSRVSGRPEFNGEIPAAALAEDMDTPGTGRIRGLLTMAGNPVLSLPNGRRLERALPELEFMVSTDIYLNETTRHAHLLLPASFGLEHDHYGLLTGVFSPRSVAKYSAPVLRRPEGTREDWDIALDLAHRLFRRRGLAGAAAASLMRALRPTPRRVLDLMLRLGPFGKRPWSRGGLTLAALEAAPHGIDLGPAVPRLREIVGRRRIPLVPEPLRRELARIAREELAAPGLRLVGRRSLRSNNSWMHNVPRLVSGRDRCTLLMNPADAASRSLRTGQLVEVASRVGRVQVPLEVTGEMMPGVVSLPHGWGHGRAGARLSVAAGRPGASMNDLTDEQCVDRVSGCAVLSGVPVEVRAAAPAPATTDRRPDGALAPA